MKYLKNFNLNESILRFESFNEAELSTHYIARFNLRAEGYRIISKGGNYDMQEFIKRLNFLLSYLGMTLMDKFPGTQENKVLCVNFGDIKIKYNDNIYLPIFKVKKEIDQSIEYSGSVFVACIIKTVASTLELFDRNASEEDIKIKIKDHFIRNGEINKFESIEHVYLKDKENIIDLDISFEEFERKITGNVKSTIFKEPVRKEMVFSPGTKVKYYGKDGDIIEKTVDRTERNYTLNGQVIPFRIYFDDRTFKNFKKEDKFIVTPANETESDKKKSAELNQVGNNFVGKIFDIGTYSKEKYKGRGASKGGAADYVRIMATSVF